MASEGPPKKSGRAEARARFALRRRLFFVVGLWGCLEFCGFRLWGFGALASGLGAWGFEGFRPCSVESRGSAPVLGLAIGDLEFFGFRALGLLGFRVEGWGSRAFGL